MLTEDMRPTERRHMVDEVIGLQRIKDVEKECREESNSQKKMIETLEKDLFTPIPPQKPENYVSSDVLQEQLKKQIQIKTMRDSLTEVEEPSEPESLDFGEEVLAKQEKYLAAKAVVSSLEDKIQNLPELNHEYSKEELNDFLDDILLGKPPIGFS